MYSHFAFLIKIKQKFDEQKQITQNNENKKK